MAWSTKIWINFRFDGVLIETYPSINITLGTFSKILTNNHLFINCIAHFIPEDEYTIVDLRWILWKNIEQKKIDFVFLVWCFWTNYKSNKEDIHSNKYPLFFKVMNILLQLPQALFMEVIEKDKMKQIQK